MKNATAGIFFIIALGFGGAAHGQSASPAIAAVWANDGGDKVTQDELRASNCTSVTNSLWDGSTISLFGAMNEVVNFNMILEAPTSSAANVSVTVSNLSGPNGSVIRYAPRSANGLFDWTTTEIEVFYVGYLQILGLSGFGGTLAGFQEPTFPKRAQCPPPEAAGCAWTDRPVANKFYPDIAVPIELVPGFNIATGNNQSIWVDIYIPKTASAGIYTGSVTIRENGVVTHSVPIRLKVRNFALPDSPNSKTMLFSETADLSPRYGDANAPQALRNEMLVAHRHRLSLIDGDNMGAGWSVGSPASQWLPFLDGSAFTAANGYAGPGVGTGNGVFSIGTYGLMTSGTTQSAFTTNFNNWESWFEANSAATERFVYLCDETACNTGTPDLPTQLGWWSAITGPGRNLHTMATQPLLDAVSTILSDPTSSWPSSEGPSNRKNGYTSVDQDAADSVLAAEPTRRLFAYNGGRPGSGSFSTEETGAALRELPWGQYKKSIDRWFFWESTYYYNYQWTGAMTNVFTSAQTFGPAPQAALQASYGMANYYNNGDGVLFYPGTDLIYPANSYGINGPITSLRLKHWRRGIQDVDYLVLASQINQTAVQNLVDQMIPQALWENQCADPANDCSYFIGPVSWSENPDDWEAARSKLADIIEPESTVTHNFNGDAFSDIAWRDASGNTAIWLMNGTTVTNPNSSFVANVAGQWGIVGQRDFNGDGYADLLWHDGSGNVAIWEMNGTAVSNANSSFVGNVPTQWSIVGTGDFNGDGMGDILWQDMSGNVAIWEMSGTAILNQNSSFVANVPGPWSIVGTGDFNGDGKADILWQDTSGNVAIWEMNGTSILNQSSSYVANVPGPWSIKGTGDFNGDGKADILWHDTSGNVAIWEMNGTAILNQSSSYVGNVPGQWSILLTGDYNGDGFSDILWQDTSGNVAIWEMNGIAVSNPNSSFVGNVPGPWSIQHLSAE
jgi:hypothetical protein